MSTTNPIRKFNTLAYIQATQGLKITKYFQDVQAQKELQDTIKEMKNYVNQNR